MEIEYNKTMKYSENNNNGGGYENEKNVESIFKRCSYLYESEKISK